LKKWFNGVAGDPFGIIIIIIIILHFIYKSIRGLTIKNIGVLTLRLYMYLFLRFAYMRWSAKILDNKKLILFIFFPRTTCSTPVTTI